MNEGHALVTGADQPVGAAIAAALCESADRVVAGGADGGSLEALAAEHDGDGLTTVRADPRDEFDLERLAETASREADGGLALVVPAARARHGAPDGPITDTAYAAVDDELRTNVRGVYATVREAEPHCDDGTAVLVPVWDPEETAGTYAVCERAIEQLVAELAASTDLAIAAVVVGDDADAAAEAVLEAAARPLAEFDGRLIDGA